MPHRVQIVDGSWSAIDARDGRASWNRIEFRDQATANCRQIDVVTATPLAQAVREAGEIHLRERMPAPTVLGRAYRLPGREVELNERTGEEVVGSAISSRGGVGDGSVCGKRPVPIHPLLCIGLSLLGAPVRCPLHESNTCLRRDSGGPIPPPCPKCDWLRAGTSAPAAGSQCVCLLAVVILPGRATRALATLEHSIQLRRIVHGTPLIYFCLVAMASSLLS